MSSSHDPEIVGAGTYDKNRRYSVAKGTTYVHTRAKMFSLSSGIGSHYAREFQSEQVIKVASREWTRIHQRPVPWDCVQITITHVTSEVFCEFRVEEEI